MDRFPQETIEILLIDDNRGYVHQLRDDLESIDVQNFTITNANLLSTGLEHLNEKNFDAILTELSLPDSEGIDTFSTLSALASDTPILVVTAQYDESLALQTVRAGSQDYLVKGQFRTASLIRSIYYAIERQRTKTKYKRTALIDDLTGLYNRRGFYYLARQQIKLARRTTEDLLLILADLDNMKALNDNFGHHEGDQALRIIASLLKHTFRSTDIISRLDGDEFIILAIGAKDQSAEVIKDRLRTNLNSHNNKNGSYSLYLSLGSAQYDRISDMTLEDLIAQADKDLYKHKPTKKRPSNVNNRSSKVI